MKILKSNSLKEIPSVKTTLFSNEGHKKGLNTGIKMVFGTIWPAWFIRTSKKV